MIRKKLSLIISILFVCCCSSIAVSPHLEMFNTIADSIYQAIESKLDKNQGTTIIINIDENTKNKQFNAILTNKIVKSGRYKVSDHKNLDKIFKQSMLQNDPAFKGKNIPKPGNFKAAQWILIGELKVRYDYRFFKSNYYLNADINLDHLETGLTCFKKHFEMHEKSKLSIWIYITVIIILILLVYIVNFVTKGYYAELIAITAIVIIFLLTIWFFWL